MFEASQLLGFLAAAVTLIVIPGPNTLVILTQGAGGGRGAGLATVAGIELGTLGHTLAAAAGLSTLLSRSVAAVLIVKLAGVAYLFVLGIRTFLQPPLLLSSNDAVVLRRSTAFRRALFVSLLNPKSALFFLAFLPQFVRPERGAIAAQFVLLGLIVCAVGTVVGSTVALTAAALAAWLRRHAAFGIWRQRITGTILIGLAVRLAL